MSKGQSSQIGKVVIDFGTHSLIVVNKDLTRMSFQTKNGQIKTKFADRSDLGDTMRSLGLNVSRDGKLIYRKAS